MRNHSYHILFFILLSPFVVSAESPSLEVSLPVREFMKTYCLKCHNAEKHKGDMRLDLLSPKFGNGADAQLWQDVLDIINIGDMPPEEAKQPKPKELATAIGLLTDDLVNARKLLSDNGGEVVLRRMNEIEYINTVNMLTGVKLPERFVPDDESGTDFNTLGHYQTFSPAMLEQYEEAATYAVSTILLQGRAPKGKRSVVREDKWKDQILQREAKIKAMYVAHEKAKKVPKGTLEFRPYGFRNDTDYKNALKNPEQNFYVPLLRHYIANPRGKTGVLIYQASMGPLSTGIQGKGDFRAEYIVRARVAAEAGMRETDKVLRAMQFQAGRFIKLGYRRITGTVESPQIVEVRCRPEPGTFSISLGVMDNFKIRKVNTSQIQKGKSAPAIWVDWMEIDGPIYTDWHESIRRELLQGVSEESISNAGARKIFQSFATKAFRGSPVQPEFIDRLMAVYRVERKTKKDVVGALVRPMATILTTPQFLYLGEDKSQKKNADGRDALAGHEMATRLSYMLWKEAPSVKLLADGDRLVKDKAFREATIDDMMKDPKFDRFVREFFGQWLHLKKFDGIVFENTMFPDFGREKRFSAREQVFAFIRHVVANDQSLTQLIDSKYTFVNGILAEYYRELSSKNARDEAKQMPLTVGDEFVKIKLIGRTRNRGGLLGMAAIQAMGSTGERTSPVERGAFILRKFLNSPPPPPPPNVPQLSHDEEGLSVRQKLAKHKQMPQCFSCHQKMDDMGLAMEQFDAVGRWRDRENQEPIKTAGFMPDRSAFENFNGMKQELLKHRDKMIESMAEALIAYGLGRDSEFSDQDYVEAIVKQTRENDYRFSGVLRAFIGHDKFNRK